MIYRMVSPEPIASILETTKPSMHSDRFVQQVHQHGCRLIGDVCTRSMRLTMTQRRLFHQCEITPEVHQTVRAAEQGGEIRRIHEHDVAGALLIWRHPEQAIELRVASCGEGM